jgi:hypothetical protein
MTRPARSAATASNFSRPERIARRICLSSCASAFDQEQFLALAAHSSYEAITPQRAFLLHSASQRPATKREKASACSVGDGLHAQSAARQSPAIE